MKDPNLNPDPELLEAFRKANFGSQVFDQIYRPLTTIYIDMEMLFDYQLAALLRMIRTDVELQYMRSRFKDYKTYKGDDICNVFPKLKFTQQQIQDFLHDPKNIPYLSKCGILTNISNMVPNYITMAEFDGKEFTEPDEIQSTVHFVNRYFLPTPESMNAIESSLKPFSKNLNCTFKHVAPEKDSVGRLTQSSTILVKDIKTFLLPESSVYKILFEEFKLKHTALVADYRLEDDADPYLKSSMHDLAKKTEEVLSTFCFFYFLDRHPLFLVDPPSE